MRILLHDFGAYGFIAHLARWLAGQGHMVLHLRSGELVGPQGITTRQADDPPGLRFEALSLGHPFTRYALHRRLPDELRYGRQLGKVIARWRPDIILSANTPPFAQAWALRAARRQGVPFINWVQDIFSEGAGAMTARFPWPLGDLALCLLRRVEYSSMSGSQAVIVISQGFRDRLRLSKVEDRLILVQENWASSQAIAEGDVTGHDWSVRNGLNGRRLLLAAGTLGLKHDPSLLAELATALAGDQDLRVVVVSQGLGREHLETWRQGRDTSLVLLDYQPAAEVPAMLAAAEIGLVLLTAVAGGMSVPSKVYTYAAAGLPILAAVPPDNHVAKLIQEQGLGLVVAPDDPAGFIAAARRLLTDADLRGRCASAGRDFSARHGDMNVIGGRFERLLADTVSSQPAAPRRLPCLPAGPESDYLCTLALAPRTRVRSVRQRLDPDRLYSLARSHGMLPLLKQAQTRGEAVRDENLHAQQKRQMMRTMALGAVLLELMAALEAQGIKALALKGPALALLLQEEVTRRPCSDIDLLVAPGQAVAAAAIIREHGFIAQLDIPIHSLVMVSKDCPYRRGDLCVELHWRLFDNPRLLGWSFEELWQAQAVVRWNGHAIPTLSARHYGLYLAIHGMRHGWVRLRWLVDIGLLLNDPTHHKAIREQAAMDGQEPALAHTVRLACDLLGMVAAPEKDWPEGWRTQAIDRAVTALSTILTRPGTTRGAWIRRRLTEKWLDLLLCNGPRAVVAEIQLLLFGAGEMADIPLPRSLFWLYPLIRPFLLLRRILRRAWWQRGL